MMYVPHPCIIRSMITSLVLLILSRGYCCCNTVNALTSLGISSLSVIRPRNSVVNNLLTDIGAEFGNTFVSEQEV